MIASEPLTFEQKDWMEVKTNTMVVITPKVSPLHGYDSPNGAELWVADESPSGAYCGESRSYSLIRHQLKLCLTGRVLRIST
jgi:hypothetical protein